MTDIFSSKKLTSKDFNTICRICLSDEIVSPILATFIGELKIVDLLKYSVEIEVKYNDRLPPNICENCLNEVYKIYEFKKQCQDIEIALKSLLEKNQEEDNEQDEEIINITVVEEAENQCISTVNKEAKLKSVPLHQKCEFCDKVFPKHRLKEHVRSHTNERPHQCDMCPRSFNSFANLKRHRMTHTGERPFVCSKCGKGFIQYTSLQRHENNHQNFENISPVNIGAATFTCTHCGRSFRRLHPFALHVKKHTSRGQIDQSEEGAKPRALKMHREKSLLCSDCGRRFATKAGLQTHRRVHTGERPHTCHVCKKSFAFVGNLDSHMLIHTGLKPYSCDHCHKQFKQLTHLTYHLRTHSGEKPYTCTYCNRSFAVKGNLTVHIRTHTGETPHVCDVCGKGFYDTSNLKKHKRKGACLVPKNEELLGVKVEQQQLHDSLL